MRFLSSPKVYENRSLVKLRQADFCRLNRLLQRLRGHEKTAFVTEHCPCNAGSCLQLLIFQAQPCRRKTALIIQGIFPFLRLNAVAAPVGGKDHKSDLRLGEMLLAGHKFRQNQNLSILRGVFQL